MTAARKQSAYIENVSLRITAGVQGVHEKYRCAGEAGRLCDDDVMEEDADTSRSSRAAIYNIRSFGERVALNTPIQGTAADIIKLAMIHVDKALREQKLQARLVLQVHDELIVECPIEEREQVTALLTEQMEHVAKLSVPLLAEAKSGVSWYEAK